MEPIVLNYDLKKKLKRKKIIPGQLKLIFTADKNNHDPQSNLH